MENGKITAVREMGREANEGGKEGGKERLGEINTAINEKRKKMGGK